MTEFRIIRCDGCEAERPLPRPANWIHIDLSTGSSEEKYPLDFDSYNCLVRYAMDKVKETPSKE